MLATLGTEGPGYASARPPKPGVAGSNPAGGTSMFAGVYRLPAFASRVVERLVQRGAFFRALPCGR